MITKAEIKRLLDGVPFEINVVLVSRHKATLEIFQEVFPGIKIISGNASPEDIKGKLVIGNIPLYLINLAVGIYSLEFEKLPPRGEEYNVEETLENLSINYYEVFSQEKLHRFIQFIEGRRNDYLEEGE